MPQSDQFTRRSLLATAATANLVQAAPDANARLQPGRMKLATQHASDDATLQVMSSLGVTHICATLPSKTLDEKWSVDGLLRLRERVEKQGLKLDMVPIPLSSLVIDKVEMPNIMLGRSPERDREIEQIQTMLRNCAQAGIPAVKYNMSILGVVRTERTKGRGASSYSTFKYNLGDQSQPTAAGRVTADTAWERITYFLDRVVPVANETKVRIACHPHDPGMPPGKGFRGVERVLGSVDGLKRFISIKESPYHGLNFCQGTVSEMLQDPGREIFDVIRYFGKRKKIFNVHFRNIHGKFLDFQETFPDNGSVNMLDAMKVYQEIGYEGTMMPDHVPQIPGDEGGRQAFAYAFGYMRAAMQMVGASS